MKKRMTTKRRMMEEQFALMEQLHEIITENNKLKENSEIQKAHFEFMLTQYNYVIGENNKLKGKIQYLEDLIEEQDKYIKDFKKLQDQQRQH